MYSPRELGGLCCGSLGESDSGDGVCAGEALLWAFEDGEGKLAATSSDMMMIDLWRKRGDKTHRYQMEWNYQIR